MFKVHGQSRQSSSRYDTAYHTKAYDTTYHVTRLAYHICMRMKRKKVNQLFACSGKTRSNWKRKPTTPQFLSAVPCWTTHSSQRDFSGQKGTLPFKGDFDPYRRRVVPAAENGLPSTVLDDGTGYSRVRVRVRV